MSLVEIAHEIAATELPVSSRSLDLSRRCKWPAISRSFNSVFYRALADVGVAQDRAHRDIVLLSSLRSGLGLTEREVRGAYGIEHGVFGADGLFVRRGFVGSGDGSDYVEGPDYNAMLLAAGQDDERVTTGPFTADQWPAIEIEALAACSGKKDQVDIAEEYRWIRANLYEWPKFGKAPSRGAIKEWLAISRPGNEAWMRDFLDTQRVKRLSPGDGGAKKRAAKAFAEDETGDVEKGADEHMARLREMLKR